MLLERLLDNLSVRVRPFASCDISPDWRLRLRGQDAVTLHFVLRGEGTIATPGAVSPLHPGSLAVVPARVPHALTAGEHAAHTAPAGPATAVGDVAHYVAGDPTTGEEDHLLVACGHIDVVYAGGVGLFEFLHEPLVVDFADSHEMRTTFERLLSEQRRGGPPSRAMTGALMTQSLVLILRRVCDEPECPLPWLDALEDPALGPALDAILERPGRRHSLESLAATAHLSRSVFAERFVACFGVTPMAFVRLVRLRAAASVLAGTDLPIEAVATKVGFASRSHFSRAFRRWSGLSPTEFRAGQSPDTPSD